MTYEGAYDIIYSVQDAYDPYAWLFFLAAFMLGPIFAFQLFLVVISNTYNITLANQLQIDHYLPTHLPPKAYRGGQAKHLNEAHQQALPDEGMSLRSIVSGIIPQSMHVGLTDGMFPPKGYMGTDHEWDSRGLGALDFDLNPKNLLADTASEVPSFNNTVCLLKA